MREAVVVSLVRNDHYNLHRATHASDTRAKCHRLVHGDRGAGGTVPPH